MSREEKRKRKIIIKKNKAIYLLLMLFGIACFLSSLFLYGSTVVTSLIYVPIILLGGVLGVQFDKIRYGFTYKLEGFAASLGAFGQHSFFLGGFFCLVFFGSNYYLSSSSTELNEYPIKDRKVHISSGSKRTVGKSPVFTILIDQRDKELTFDKKYLKDFDAFTSIDVTSRKGLFGLTIVVDKKLKR